MSQFFCSDLYLLIFIHINYSLFQFNNAVPRFIKILMLMKLVST